MIREAAKHLDQRSLMLLHSLSTDLLKLAERIDFIVEEEKNCEGLHQAGCVCGVVAMNLDDVRPVGEARSREKADGT